MRNGCIRAALVLGLAAGAGAIAGARDASVAVFVNLPVSHGFSDATHALVDAQDAVRASLGTASELRLVDRAEEADAVVTVLGRGTGDAELTTAFNVLNRSVVAPPVPIGPNERYIEVLVTTGPCRTLGLAVADDSPESCYRRVFVGVGFSALDEQQRPKTRQLNSWTACAEAVAKDVRAWLISNAARLQSHRGRA